MDRLKTPAGRVGLACAPLISALVGAPALAQDGWEDEDTSDDAGWGDDGSDDAGWGDDGSDDAGWGDDGGDDVGFGGSDDPPPALKPPRRWSIRGFVSSQDALWVERLDSEPVGLARQTAELSFSWSGDKLRALATGHGEFDPYYFFKGEEDYDQATYDEYAWMLQPRELWVGGSAGPVEITAGRQSVSWGEGLLISPLNRVNPVDFRDMGSTDVTELRLPVTMLRLQYFPGRHRLEAMVVPEADFGFRSPPEGPYGLVEGLAEVSGAEAQLEEYDFTTEEILDRIDTSWVHLQDRWAADQIQVYGRWGWRGSGVDLALYAASFLDKQGVIVVPEDDPVIPTAEVIAIPLDHRRYTMFGHSGAAAFSSLLLRWELAAELGRPVNVGDILVPNETALGVYGAKFGAETDARDVYTGMLGLGYSGIPETRVDVEFAQGYVPEGTDDMVFPVGVTQYGLRFSRALLKQRLEIVGLGLGLGLTFEYGFTGSLSATYTIADGLKATLGYITYQPGELASPIVGFDTHDRLFTQIRYDF